MTNDIGSEEVRACAAGCGLSLLRVSGLKAPAAALERLRFWQMEGHAGAMGYMNRPPELFADAQRLFPEARAIVVCAVCYAGADAPAWKRGMGRVARYAWGRDYHGVLKHRLKSFVNEIESRLERRVRAKIIVDAAPLLERALAAQAGVGWTGRNSMLIVPGQGSYTFLGEVLWDVSLTNDCAAGGAPAAKCGGCSKCVESCPTGAIIGDGLVDARLCRSYLTIEKREALAEAERELLGEWVFGCDVCQEVCPHNSTPVRADSGPDCDEFRPDRGCGPMVALDQVLSIRSAAEYQRWFGQSPLRRCRREGLLRNAAVVAGNTGAVEVVPALLDAIGSDSSGLVRQHALWGLWKITVQRGAGESGELRRSVAKSLKDPDPAVREEASRISAKS